MRFILILFVTISIYSELMGQRYIGDNTEINKILKNSKDFSTYIVNSDYEMIGKSYTEEAKIFPQGGKILTGKEFILRYWRLPKGERTIHHKIISSEIIINNNTAYDHGYYEGTTQKLDGIEIHWKGKYVIVWQRIAGEWKMYLDIWNNI